jgi:hypothetical protein
MYFISKYTLKGLITILFESSVAFISIPSAFLIRYG